PSSPASWARTTCRLPDRPARRRPVRRDDGPDERGARHRPPRARVARADAVVAHHEVLLRPELRPRARDGVAVQDRQVRLVQLVPVDVEEARLLRDDVAGNADHALQIGAALGALLLRRSRRREHGDLTAPWVAEAVDDL